MIETYAFLAAFTLQIVVLSILHPAWLTGYARAKAEAQLPGLDSRSRDRFLRLYRVGNAGIAVLGLTLLGWIFSQLHRPDWDVRSVSLLLRGYVVVQILPIVLLSLIGARVKRNALASAPPDVKRTASLQRRGLFDFVPPLTAAMAVAGYVLIAGFVLYTRQHPLPGVSGDRLLGSVTLVYALNAFCVYWLLYRRTRWPLETGAYRLRAIGVQVRILVYTSIAYVVFMSLNVALELLDMPRWVPFAMSVYLVIIMLISSLLFALRRQAEEDRIWR